jgi:hypothetical protein
MSARTKLTFRHRSMTNRVSQDNILKSRHFVSCWVSSAICHSCCIVVSFLIDPLGLPEEVRCECDLAGQPEAQQLAWP